MPNETKAASTDTINMTVVATLGIRAGRCGQSVLQEALDGVAIARPIISSCEDGVATMTIAVPHGGAHAALNAIAELQGVGSDTKLDMAPTDNFTVVVGHGTFKGLLSVNGSCGEQAGHCVDAANLTITEAPGTALTRIIANVSRTSRDGDTDVSTFFLHVDPQTRRLINVCSDGEPVSVIVDLLTNLSGPCSNNYTSVVVADANQVVNLRCASNTTAGTAGMQLSKDGYTLNATITLDPDRRAVVPASFAEHTSAFERQVAFLEQDGMCIHLAEPNGLAGLARGNESVATNRSHVKEGGRFNLAPRGRKSQIPPEQTKQPPPPPVPSKGGPGRRRRAAEEATGTTPNTGQEAIAADVSMRVNIGFVLRRLTEWSNLVSWEQLSYPRRHSIERSSRTKVDLTYGWMAQPLITFTATEPGTFNFLLIGDFRARLKLWKKFWFFSDTMKATVDAGVVLRGSFDVSMALIDPGIGGSQPVTAPQITNINLGDPEEWTIRFDLDKGLFFTLVPYILSLLLNWLLAGLTAVFPVLGPALSVLSGKHPLQSAFKVASGIWLPPVASLVASGSVGHVPEHVGSRFSVHEAQWLGDEVHLFGPGGKLVAVLLRKLTGVIKDKVITHVLPMLVNATDTAPQLLDEVKRHAGNPFSSAFVEPMAQLLILQATLVGQQKMTEGVNKFTAEIVTLSQTSHVIVPGRTAIVEFINEPVIKAGGNVFEVRSAVNIECNDTPDCARYTKRRAFGKWIDKHGDADALVELGVSDDAPNSLLHHWHAATCEASGGKVVVAAEGGGHHCQRALQIVPGVAAAFRTVAPVVSFDAAAKVTFQFVVEMDGQELTATAVATVDGVTSRDGRVGLQFSSSPMIVDIVSTDAHGEKRRHTVQLDMLELVQHAGAEFRSVAADEQLLDTLKVLVQTGANIYIQPGLRRLASGCGLPLMPVAPVFWIKLGDITVSFSEGVATIKPSLGEQGETRFPACTSYLNDGARRGQRLCPRGTVVQSLLQYASHRSIDDIKCCPVKDVVALSRAIDFAALCDAEQDLFAPIPPPADVSTSNCYDFTLLRDRPFPSRDQLEWASAQCKDDYIVVGVESSGAYSFIVRCCALVNAFVDYSSRQQVVQHTTGGTALSIAEWPSECQPGTAAVAHLSDIAGLTYTKCCALRLAVGGCPTGLSISESCSGRGSCIAVPPKSSATATFTKKCSCDEGFSGRACENECQVGTDDRVCSGHGECVSDGSCDCQQGWYGGACEHALCARGCSRPNGACTHPGQCECKPGWSGPACSQPSRCNDEHSVCFMYQLVNKMCDLECYRSSCGDPDCDRGGHCPCLESIAAADQCHIACTVESCTDTPWSTCTDRCPQECSPSERGDGVCDPDCASCDDDDGDCVKEGKTGSTSGQHVIPLFREQALPWASAFAELMYLDGDMRGDQLVVQCGKKTKWTRTARIQLKPFAEKQKLLPKHVVIDGHVDVYHTQGAVVVAFRGTDDVPLWALNLVGVSPAECQLTANCGQVHSGFQQLLLSKYEELADAIGASMAGGCNGGSCRVLFTGHSLGGVLAQMSAMKFVGSFPNLRASVLVRAFGAPRFCVAGTPCRAAFEGQELDAISYVAACGDNIDVIPSAPPKKLGYELVGRQEIVAVPPPFAPLDAFCHSQYPAAIDSVTGHRCRVSRATDNVGSNGGSDGGSNTSHLKTKNGGQHVCANEQCVAGFRLVGCNTTSGGKCVPCHEPPQHASYSPTQSSSDAATGFVDTCSRWACDSGFYKHSNGPSVANTCAKCRPDTCADGFFLLGCLQSSPGECTTCSNIPAYARPTLNGGTQDSCPWECLSGYTRKKEQCVACPATHYSLGGAAGTCRKHGCDAGSRLVNANDATDVSQCEPCERGTFSVGGLVTVCTEHVCQPGHAITNRNSTVAITGCRACKRGEWSMGGSVTTRCEKHSCPEGSLLANLESTTSRSDCIACPSDHFSLGGVAGACTAHFCDSGFRVLNAASKTKSSACEPCPPSTFSEPGLSSTCTNHSCPAGSVVTNGNVANSSSACAPCPPNTYSTGGFVTACATKACPPGHVLGNPLATDTAEQCHRCQPGTFSYGGLSQDCADHRCAAGQHLANINTTTSRSECTACQAGKYSLGGSMESCLLHGCDSGQFLRNVDSRTEPSVCPPCPDSEHGGGGQAIACTACATDCPSGHFRQNCSGASPGSCRTCTEKPQNAHFTDNGRLEDACPWRCQELHFQADTNGGNARCDSCSADCLVGFFKSGCGELSSGTCVKCTALPDNARASSHGGFQNDCAWSCNPAYFRVVSSVAKGAVGVGHFRETQGSCRVCAKDCPHGEYRCDCGGVDAGSCTACSTKPDNGAIYTSGGGLTNDCDWRCAGGWYQASAKVCERCRQCGTGKYLEGCSGASAGECQPCSGKPAQSTYTGDGGFANTCPFTCNAPFYHEAGRCDRCSGRDYCSSMAGDCSVSDGKAQCACKAGFSGTRCEQCAVGHHCNNHATGCKADAEGRFVCTTTEGRLGCDQGWEGPTCANCAGAHFCKSRGTCSVSETGDPECTCGKEFAGTECGTCAAGRYPAGTCDVPCRRESTCSRHGQCSDVGKCVCDRFAWYGFPWSVLFGFPSEGFPWTGSDCSTAQIVESPSSDCPSWAPRVLQRKWSNVHCDGDCSDCDTNGSNEAKWFPPSVTERSCAYRDGKSVRLFHGEKCWVSLLSVPPFPMCVVLGGLRCMDA